MDSRDIRLVGGDRVEALLPGAARIWRSSGESMVPTVGDGHIQVTVEVDVAKIEVGDYLVYKQSAVSRRLRRRTPCCRYRIRSRWIVRPYAGRPELRKGFIYRAGRRCNWGGDSYFLLTPRIQPAIAYEDAASTTSANLSDLTGFRPY